ncbi:MULTISPECIES: hypothetical protein [Bacillus cereus group]|uniref:hypothetical protein n=1 Tax=Bacillus cereus group TaxID=86661 RepID=UPI001F21E05F|nr:MULTISPECIES: hypothetical protein [Bacillus cereus group]
MKAKKLLTLALPIMLLSACTLDTYGLTQAEFRKVDKEFKADKMIKDMKQLHYSDEQIEAQLRGALSQLEYEEKQRNGENTESETEEDKQEEKKKVKSSIYVSATDYVDFMFRELVTLKDEIRTLNKESKAISEGRYEGAPKDTVMRISSQLEELERVDVPKKYADYNYEIKEGIESMQNYIPKLEKAVDNYEESSDDKKKVKKEEVDKAIKGLEKDMQKWEPFFADMNDKDPTALKRAINEKYDGSKKDLDSFVEDTSSTTDESIDYTPKK